MSNLKRAFPPVILEWLQATVGSFFLDSISRTELAECAPSRMTKKELRKGHRWNCAGFLKLTKKTQSAWFDDLWSYKEKNL